MNEIPVVDFSSVGLEHDDISEAEWKSVSKEIYKALSEIGFVYLTGHGMPKELIQECFRFSKEFFDQPMHVKLQYEKDSDDINGYSSVGLETLDPNKNQMEIRESINLTLLGTEGKLPKEIQDRMKFYFQTCGRLIHRILKAIGYGLQLKDVDTLVKFHTYDNSWKNRSLLRFLHYPPIDPSEEDKATETTRCGEHADYGSVTILIQCEGTGEALQVKNRAGQYICAPVIQDTVLVNIGLALQRWTSDKLVATEHKVVIQPGLLNERRFSIAFFGYPDDDVLLECFDGSNKYPPIKSQDFLDMKYKQTYSSKHY